MGGLTEGNEGNEAKKGKAERKGKEEKKGNAGTGEALERLIVRVIAGTAKGRPLASVPGDSTRAITDRVKTALFSILVSQGVVAGTRWLDLFGGTGAVGIEALSRGAAEVVFVERSHQAIRVLGQNLSHTGLNDRSHVVRGDAFDYLRRAGVGPFDLIYVAPPQYQEMWQKALRLIDSRPELLAADGQVVVQIHPKEDDPELVLQNLIRYDERQYGSTRLIFYEPA